MLDLAHGGALEAQTLGGAREARTLGGAWEAWTLGGALEARTLGGALEARTLHSAFEGPALVGALEAKEQLSAFEGLALEGAVEERALEGAVEALALAWSNLVSLGSVNDPTPLLLSKPSDAKPGMDAELFHILSKEVEELGLEWSSPKEPTCSFLDEWFLLGCHQAPRQRASPFLLEVHDELTRPPTQPTCVHHLHPSSPL